MKSKPKIGKLKENISQILITTKLISPEAFGPVVNYIFNEITKFTKDVYEDNAFKAVVGEEQSEPCDRYICAKAEKLTEWLGEL